jgi:hypothetical protein
MILISATSPLTNIQKNGSYDQKPRCWNHSSADHGSIAYGFCKRAILSKTAIVYYGEKSIAWDAFKNFKEFNVFAKWVEHLPQVVGVVRLLQPTISQSNTKC